MYICNNCGKTFDDCVVVYDSVPYGSTNVDYPSECVCPHCGDDDIEEVKVCSCGDIATQGRLCNNCAENFKFDIKEICKKYEVDLDAIDEVEW